LKSPARTRKKGAFKPEEMKYSFGKMKVTFSDGISHPR
jgi:hypothetical protein